ncbi:uncharacterized protein LOC129594486 isoform X2 [Paramacrobiotus metropolitanus]|uniref:uncharacterized protein LOC129594486 isoform X2 n=1 Tax=Paramacrobiotus metropolitanus TaxID=2943436 RepID=UPI002445B7DE|nr:uncharacterized protein LOC129594486 isoform X2 [Paramacrobiotus metropolitanus]
MPEQLGRTSSYESTKSSSIRTSSYIQGVPVAKEKISPSPSTGGKPPTYTLQKAARMAARVNTTWARIASVIAYLLAISAIGFVLVLYYVLFYNPYVDIQLEAPPDEFLVRRDRSVSIMESALDDR